MTRYVPHDRAWYERRLEGFGGSEAPALLGLSRWRSARQVIEEKARRIIPDPDAKQRLRLRLGNEMEPILLEHLWEALVERDGTSPRPRTSKVLHRSKVWPWMTANVDGFLGDAVVELKTDEYGYEDWGQPEDHWEKALPAAYGCQVQHNIGATGKRRALVLVLIGLHEERLYEIPRDDDYIADLAEVQGEAWRTVVACRERLAADPDASLDDLLPPPEGPGASAYLRSRYPASTDVVRSATAEDELLVAALADARRARIAAEKAEAALEVKVQTIIGEAAGLSTRLGTITWKSAKDSIRTEWESVASAYRKVSTILGGYISDGLWPEVLEAHPELAAWWIDTGGAEALEATLSGIQRIHTSTRPGSRSFRVPSGWDKSPE